MLVAVPFLALLAVGIACSALGCCVPIAAIAAAAALNLPRRSGLTVVAAVWIVDQAIGFAYKQYPHDPSTIAWGVGLGVAAFAAYGIARVAAVNPLVAFLGAFVAFEAVLVLFSVKLGGWEAYAPRWIAQIFATNLAWFVGAFVTLRLLARRPLFGGAAAR
jgi:hypothetical protein